jgi:hypothetical protein
MFPAWYDKEGGAGGFFIPFANAFLFSSISLSFFDPAEGAVALPGRAC